MQQSLTSTGTPSDVPAVQLEKINFKDTGKFSKIFLDYLGNEEELRAFYPHRPDLDAVAEIIRERNFDSGTRSILSKVLKEQYSGLERSGTLDENLEKLKDDNTFTITTGHQLNLCSGPLYFIYKIVTCINACQVLSEKFPEKHFVPVYWMASEDHDFEEINHFNLFGKNYQWETGQSGPVGRFSLEGLDEILKSLPESAPLFEEAYSGGRTLSEATRYYVNELFGRYGLVVIDADQPELKNIFKPVMKDDLLNHHANDLVEDQSSQLQKLGYNPQVFPRAINLFYMRDGLRSRIVKSDGQYEVLKTDLRFTEAEILELLDKNPEYFSPNVVLRPVYQEMILPNLAYIGGPGELAYWLQLSGVFDHYQIPFPMLLPRNHALILNPGLQKKMDKIGVAIEELFLDEPEIRKILMERNNAQDYTLAGEIEGIQKVFEEIMAKTMGIDKSLESVCKAEEVKTVKSLENLEKRLKKSEERKQEVVINQLAGLLNKLFPNQGLQERYDNLLNYSINNPHFIEQLVNSFDPFDQRFNVVIHE